MIALIEREIVDTDYQKVEESDLPSSNEGSLQGSDSVTEHFHDNNLMEIYHAPSSESLIELISEYKVDGIDDGRTPIDKPNTAELSLENFTEFYNRLTKPVYSVLFNMGCPIDDMEDVYNETMFKAFLNRDAYIANKGSVVTWVIRIARNTFIDKRRMESSRPQKKEFLSEGHEGFIFNNVVDDGASPDEVFISKERVDVLHQELPDALTKMPYEQAEAVKLCFINGLTHTQAAELLGVSLGTFKTRVRLGLRKLRDNEAFQAVR